MATLPASGYISNAARTQGEVKTALEDVRDVAAQMWGGTAESELTIASGSITPTSAIHTVDGEGDLDDDLANAVVTNLPDGSPLILSIENAARVITVKHNAGGSGQFVLYSGSDFVMNSVRDTLVLRRSGTDWLEVTRSMLDFQQIAKTQERQTKGTAGGGMTLGSWTKRSQNHEQFDANSQISVGSGQVTIDAGTWWINAWAVGNQIGENVLEIYDTTGTASLLTGMTTTAPTGTAGNHIARISGQITLTVSSTLELRHYSSATKATDGLGIAMNINDSDAASMFEVYSEIEFWKKAR